MKKKIANIRKSFSGDAESIQRGMSDFVMETLPELGTTRKLTM